MGAWPSRALAAGLLLAAAGGAAPAGAQDRGGAAADARHTDSGPADNGQTLGSPHRGGTLRLTASSSGGTLDPQLNYTSQYAQLFAVLYDGLVTFPKAEGPDGNAVVADLAEAVPQPVDGGRTWRFVLRQGLRFSDGRAVTVADVAASMRRIFRVGSPTAGSFYGNIVGADTCLRDPAHCTLRGGLEVDPATRAVVFHLRDPDAEFLQKLAFPHASILPADLPDHDLGNVPAPTTGPYRFASYDPDRGAKLERNPYFRVWSADAQPDGYADHITYDFGLPDEAEVTAIENGQYDWMFDNKPLDRLGELGSRYAAQVHVRPLFGMYYAPMNVNLPPFDNRLARQAVNYAMDRRAMVILYGGTGVAAPLCTMVPNGIPGAIDGCSYTRGADPDHRAATWQAPDLDRARALVAQSGTRGQHVTLVVQNTAVDMSMGVYLRNMLQAIGYDASVKPLAHSVQLGYIQNTANKVQISISDWFADYPSASNFLDDLLGCENFHPGSDNSINIAGYCDRAAQALMDRAKAATDPAQAADLWAQANRAIDRDSPDVPMIRMNYIDLVSRRLGHYFYTNLYHLCFSRVWVQ
ncbi:ABC transporter substrate-binding protein [Gluconacetobacter azotocaptans]|uniref:ABC transporter substrate-binding protein n=1 Tax=Gluconacetobacter azotocaptans TaxID=142834 RepID=A0A7W4JU51_9PROT|nr:ABC transporter substrate-binding protein [Gluconacetobacter azotocaptans]MBB2190986.1 ABC transporter substrate-binding protein [Gluconacetobacter azotocaptans]